MVVDYLLGGKRPEIGGGVSIFEEHYVEPHRDSAPGSGIDTELRHAPPNYELVDTQGFKAFAQVRVVEGIAVSLVDDRRVRPRLNLALELPASRPGLQTMPGVAVVLDKDDGHAGRFSVALQFAQAAGYLAQLGIDIGLSIRIGQPGEDRLLHVDDADLALKEKILARTIPFDSKPGKFKPGDRLLAFLNRL